MFFGRKYRFWTSQAESYPTKVAVFHLGKIRKFRKIPTQIPKYFGPFLTSWLDLVPARRSVLKKAARGCPRIQIWSHEGPNQSQNHGFAHPASREARVASGFEPRHVLRKQAIFSFFPAKTRTLEKRHTKFMIFCQILLIFDQNLSQTVPGPHFSWKFWPGPKYGVSSRRNAKFCVSSRRDDRF